MPKLSIRPLTEEDIPFIINYWFEASDEDLIRIGADKSKLVSKDENYKSLLDIYNSNLDSTRSFCMIWLIDDKPMGYNALKDISHKEIAHMHLHMWNKEFRGQGFGAKLFCMAALEFYKLFNLKMILCEPHAGNPMPNKMLTKIGYKKWKTYTSQSTDLALVCELNSYIIDQKTSLNYLNNIDKST